MEDSSVPQGKTAQFLGFKVQSELERSIDSLMT